MFKNSKKNGLISGRVHLTIPIRPFESANPPHPLQTILKMPKKILKNPQKCHKNG